MAGQYTFKNSSLVSKYTARSQTEKPSLNRKSNTRNPTPSVIGQKGYTPPPPPKSSNKKACSETPQPWPTDRLATLIHPELPLQSSLCWLAVVVDTSLQHNYAGAGVSQLVLQAQSTTQGYIRARAERRTDQQPSTIIKARQGNTCTAGGCSSIPATTDPTPSVSCQDQSRWLSSRQHTGRSRLNYHLFTKFTIGPSEPQPLYQIQNWSFRTTTSLPNSQLVHQNHQLFTKFTIVHQNRHLFTKFRTGPSELPNGLPNSELRLCQVSSPTTKHLLQACLLHNNLRDQSWQVSMTLFNNL